ncbi:Pros54 [Cordylochernes scorpioides]|uniref:26S proteasome non-ATPase regulatory subunit 4 n=1 Tax=Cordylochernes scorpioides TaxID=51811 RepID=A0ABY6KEN2_9ARAC|nr:Pros54 [Cordylochernes scorpioides]UYV67219.1 Pros54 [Cordylochernes scorpioides]
MVLESTFVCVDNSEYMRNGDFVPTRLQAQQDAVSLVCHSKTRANPENNVGLLTLSQNPEVLATLTSDIGHILSKLHQVQPKGNISFLSGIRIAHMALKHRQGKNHKMRIVVFVGSPLEVDDKEIIKFAKKLKKEKVNVDIINFGEDQTANTDKLTSFINTINGKDSNGSHLVTVPPGPHLSDALISSPIVQGEDGGGAPGGAGTFEFGVDPNEDPELALALRVSMEEQRQRQEEQARRAAEAVSVPETVPESTNEEELLERALAMSMETDQAGHSTGGSAVPDFASMTEDEQIAYAMQMSLQQAQSQETPMDTDQREEDYSEVMNDPEFLQSVLENLPGVDPQSDAISSAMGTLNPERKSEEDKNKKE